MKHPEVNHNQLQWGWLARMAWRDGYASRRKLGIFMLSIVLGIAAVVAIQSFSINLRANIANQSRSLLGADYVIKTRKTPVQPLLDLVGSQNGQKAKGCNFASMVSFPSKGKTRLANVRALEGAFPFYGTMTTLPAGAFRQFQQGRSALVDATVMLQFRLKAGDTIQVGNLTYAIAGSVSDFPGQSGIAATVAPPVLIPYEDLQATGLLQKGSRIEYEFYFKSPPGINLEQHEKKLEQQLEQLDADIDTHISVAQCITRSYENFGVFLNIVAFTALLLGCIGVASAVNIYIKEKINVVAVLRCLGASKWQTLLIYLLQISCIGLAGASVGAAAGVVIQQAFPILLKDFLPVDISFEFALSPVVMGIVVGFCMAVLFSLLSLLQVWDVSPLSVLRVTTSYDTSAALIRRALVLTVIVIFIIGFTYWQLGNIKQSLYFSLGVAAVFAILAGIARLLMLLVKKIFSSSWGFAIRQSLLNLYRPNNQTVVLVAAIGIGSFLLSTLYFTRDLLLNKLSVEAKPTDPNMIIFDIQNTQLTSIKNLVGSQHHPVLQQVPIVTMRLHSLRGRDVNLIKKDTASGIREWVLTREYRVTFRDTLAASEKVVGGRIYRSRVKTNDSIFVSLEKGLARDMKAKPGDQLVFNVQGILMPAYVGSIREVDWQRMSVNFLVVFPKGVLEQAPQFHVLTTRVPGSIASARLQQLLVSNFPNVSIVDLREIIKALENILSKISTVVSFMASFTILTGLIVLTGAVRTSRNQRIGESVLLRTLGASKMQILMIIFWEYFFLGSAGSIAGILLSYLATALIAAYSLGTVFVPALLPALIIWGGITLIAAGTGILNSYTVLRRSPMEVLRAES